MREVGIRELKEKTSKILREVSDRRETIAITSRGKLIARLVPVVDKEAVLEESLKVLKEMDELAKEIGKYWPKGVSAVEAVREQRRDF